MVDSIIPAILQEMSLHSFPKLINHFSGELKFELGKMTDIEPIIIFGSIQ